MSETIPLHYYGCMTPSKTRGGGGGENPWAQDENGREIAVANQMERETQIDLGTRGELCASILGSDGTLCKGSGIGGCLVGLTPALVRSVNQTRGRGRGRVGTRA